MANSEKTYTIPVQAVPTLMAFDIPNRDQYLQNGPGYNYNNAYIDLKNQTIYCDVDIYSKNINSTNLASPTGVYTTTGTVLINSENGFSDVFNIINFNNYILTNYKYTEPGKPKIQNGNTASPSLASPYVSQKFVNNIDINNVYVDFKYKGPTGTIGPKSENGLPVLNIITLPFINFESVLYNSLPSTFNGFGGPIPPQHILTGTTKGITPLIDNNGQTIFNINNFYRISRQVLENQFGTYNLTSLNRNPFTQQNNPGWTYIIFPSDGYYYVTNRITRLYYVLVGGGGSGAAVQLKRNNTSAGGGASGQIITGEYENIPELSVISVNIGNGGSIQRELSPELGAISPQFFDGIAGNATIINILGNDNTLLHNKSCAGGGPGLYNRSGVVNGGNGGTNNNFPESDRLGWGGNGFSTSNPRNYPGYTGPYYNFQDGTGGYTFGGGGGAGNILSVASTQGYPGGSQGGGQGIGLDNRDANPNAQKISIVINNTNYNLYLGSGGGGGGNKGGNGGDGICILYWQR